MILDAGNIKLRAFQASDATTLVRLCNNKKIWENVRDHFPHPYTLKDARAFIKIATSKNPQETFAIDYEENLVGGIGIHPQADVYSLTAEIGYWVGEPYWRKGIASEAVKLITGYGFEKLGLHKIYAGCFEFNVASQKVLLKAGMHKEAVLRKSVFKNGVICDEIRYAIFKVED